MWGVAIALLGGGAAYAVYWLVGRLTKRPLRHQAENPSESRAAERAAVKRAKEARSAGFREAGDYDHYLMSKTETVTVCAIAGAVLFAIGFLFYKNIGICLVLAMAGLYFPKIRRKQMIRKRKDELRRQFKHALYSLSTALSAGRSVENAFREADGDLRMLYPDAATDMQRELARINRRTENGEPVEKSLLDFGRRSGIEDVLQFAEAFAACKRTGGDLVEVMRRTSNMIGEKMEIEQDISVMVAQKKFEARALGFIPFIIVAFLAFSSPDYMEPLYGGAGHLVMTGALGILAASQWLARKIMNIGT
ncbi:type II secretion system F family protein [Paenibacillus hodogayensis]|uniref:Type II secretion system F family protein n=1 Tax=Paenibacillus hodogayensis TaxID=279208 RepID=A0ABV5W3X0_9BACL